MRDINHLTLTGRFVRPPEKTVVKTKNGDSTLAKFSLAVNHNKDEVSFLECTAFAKLGEIICDIGKKGMKCTVTGVIKQSRWQNQEGKNRSKIDIYVNEFEAHGVSEKKSEPNGNKADEPDFPEPGQDGEVPF